MTNLTPRHARHASESFGLAAIVLAAGAIVVLALAGILGAVLR